MKQKTEKYLEIIGEILGKKANKKLVEALVKRLASVMAKADAKSVSCSDPKELERVRVNLLRNKLGVTDIEKARKILEKVCEKMKEMRNKDRIVFYYLTIVEAKAIKVYLGE